jgi:hypothetical protein
MPHVLSHPACPNLASFARPEPSFGGDKPVGADEFSTKTLEMIKRIPSAKHVTKIEEYVHTPQIDPTKPNAYAMIIGLRPGAHMRAIGEVDYENARIIAGKEKSVQLER